jgi:magnesium-transporting ATPase (P-type)
LLVAAFGLYEWELRTTGVQEQARTVAVNVFVMVEAFYLFNSRSFTRSPFALGLWTNPWVVGGFVIMVVLQMAFTYLPFMNVLFGSAPIGVLPWIKIVGVSILAFIIIEIEKWLRNRPATA